MNRAAENYPQLHANENFRQLQVAIMDTEEHLQGARRAYNSNVSELNRKVVSFPTSIVAGIPLFSSLRAIVDMFLSFIVQPLRACG